MYSKIDLDQFQSHSIQPLSECKADYSRLNQYFQTIAVQTIHRSLPAVFTKENSALEYAYKPST